MKWLALLLLFALMGATAPSTGTRRQSQPVYTFQVPVDLADVVGNPKVPASSAPVSYAVACQAGFQVGRVLMRNRLLYTDHTRPFVEPGMAATEFTPLPSSGSVRRTVTLDVPPPSDAQTHPPNKYYCELLFLTASGLLLDGVGGAAWQTAVTYQTGALPASP